VDDDGNRPSSGLFTGSGWGKPSPGQLTVNLELFRTRGIRLFN